MTDIKGPVSIVNEYIDRGWRLVLVRERSKAPIAKAWPEQCPTSEQATNHLSRGGNVGVLLGPASRNLVDIDLDVPEAITLASLFLPTTPAVFGRGAKPRSHRLYHTVTNPVYAKYAAPTATGGERKQGPTLLELRTSGDKKAHQTVLPPSVHEGGEEVAWDTFDDPATVEAEDLRRCTDHLAAAVLLVRNWPTEGHRHEAHLALHGMLLRSSWAEESVANFSRAISVGSGDGKESEHQANVRDTLARLRRGEEVTGAPRLGELVDHKVVDRVRAWLRLRPASPDPGTVDNVQRPCGYSDDALALKFSDQHSANLRYVAPWSSWYIWDGSCWRADPTLAVFDQVRALCRSEARHAAEIGENAAKLARTIQSAATIAAVERLARCDRRIAATIDQWDANLMALATPDGVIDLTTGTLRPAAREDYVTKTAAVAPAEKADCPQWHRFLDRIFAGDHDLIDFVRRLAGYALTGVTTEHVFAFLYGTGANGKSVLIATLAAILGDHATVAPSETFMAPRGDRHPVEVADLRGARLVFATEVDEGQRWNEARIKSLTGGEPIRARFMRQDFFTYTPQFLLVISGNHRPRFGSIDEAIRRRVLLIPFSVTIPTAERDKGLTEKLRQEWPGILRWCIDGCLEWQHEGLKPPSAVVNATDDYLAEQDEIANWIAEAFHLDPNGTVPVAAAFASWKEWAALRGLASGSPLSLGDSLEAHGVSRCRTNKARGFKGIRLK